MRVSVAKGGLAVVALWAVLGAGATFSALVSCASDEPAAPGSVQDASVPSLLSDAEPPLPDAEVPLGDFCGDRIGLEERSPWPMHGGCPRRGGVSTERGPQAAQVKWSVPMSAGLGAPAIGADGLVWIGTSEGNIVAVTPAGAIDSALATGHAVLSSPARSAMGHTIIGGGDGALYALDRGVETADAGADGGDGGGADAATSNASDDGGGVHAARIVFRRALGAGGDAGVGIGTPAIAPDGTLYVGLTSGQLLAIASDGSSTTWTATTNDSAAATPTIGRDGTIYLGSSDGKVHAIGPDGQAKWTFPTGGAIPGAAVVGGDDTIYAGSTDGKLYAITPDGSLRWAYATGGPIAGSAAVRAGVAYVGSDDKKLHAIDITSGAAKWTYATLGAVATPVVDAQGTVYVGSTDGNLYAIKPTGLLYFAVNVKGRIRSAPALSDIETMYVTTETALVAIGR